MEKLLNAPAPCRNSMSDALKSFMDQGDAPGFMEMCKRIKRAASEMIERDAITEARYYLEAYDSFLRIHQSPDARFNENVITLYPKNEACTFRMLGQSEALDQFILTRMVNIRAIDPFRNAPYTDLLKHAVKKEDSVLYNLMLGEMLEVAEKMDSEGTYRSAMDKVLLAVMYSISYNSTSQKEQRCASIRVEPEFDRILSSTVRVDSDHRPRWSILSEMIDFGFTQTVRACFLTGRASGYGDENELYLQDILKIFEDESPLSIGSALALVNVHQRRNARQLAFVKTLLGDSCFDFEKFIEVSCTANQFKSFAVKLRQPRLGFHQILYFGEWLSPVHLTTDLERQRAQWLVRQVCAAETAAYLDKDVCNTGMRMLNRGEPVVAYIKKMLSDFKIHPYFQQYADIIKRDALSIGLDI